MKAGPKAKLENGDVPLPFAPRTKVESERFAAFAKKFLKTPKGTGAKSPLEIHDFQMDLARAVLDSGARTVGLMLPRGSGKTTLNAAIGLYALFTWGRVPTSWWSPSTSDKPVWPSTLLAGWWSSTRSSSPARTSTKTACTCR